MVGWGIVPLVTLLGSLIANFNLRPTDEGDRVPNDGTRENGDGLAGTGGGGGVAGDEDEVEATAATAPGRGCTRRGGEEGLGWGEAGATDGGEAKSVERASRSSSRRCLSRRRVIALALALDL